MAMEHTYSMHIVDMCNDHYKFSKKYFFYMYAYIMVYYSYCL